MSIHFGKSGQAAIAFLALAFTAAACSNYGARDAQPPPRSELSSSFQGIERHPLLQESSRR